jgi:hypothetical protein
LRAVTPSQRTKARNDQSCVRAAFSEPVGTPGMRNDPHIEKSSMHHTPFNVYSQKR